MDIQAIENKEVVVKKPKNLKSGTGGHPGGSNKYRAMLRENVISRAWEVLEEFFDDPKIKKEKKAEIASRICVKSMPQELNGKLTFTLNELVENVHRATERNSGPMAEISNN